MSQTSIAEAPVDLKLAHASCLRALTPEAHQALGGDGLAIPRLPFRVGRESRRPLTKLAMSIERRLGTTPTLNDLYITEQGNRIQVSRIHFLIDATDEGFFLLDRGSACGTIVNDMVVGGDRTGGRVRLFNDDVITVGSASSPFVFQFMYR